MTPDQEVHISGADSALASQIEPQVDAANIVTNPSPLTPDTQVSRRDFLKIMGAAAALAATGQLVAPHPAKAAEPNKPWSEDFTRFLPPEHIPEGGDIVGGEPLLEPDGMTEVFRRDVLPWITPDAEGKFPEISADELFLESYGGVTRLGLYRTQDLTMPSKAGVMLQTKIVGHEYINDRLIAYGIIQDPWLGNLSINVNFGSKDYYTPLHLGKGSRNWGYGRNQKRINTAKMEKFLDRNPGIVVNVPMYCYKDDYTDIPEKYKPIARDTQAQEDFAIKAATWMAERLSLPPTLNDPPEGVFNQPAGNFDPENPNAFISVDIIYFQKPKLPDNFAS